VPLLGGAGSPSSTTWPGPRPTSMIPSGILIHPAKLGGCAPFLGRKSWVPMQHNVAWAEAYLRAKCHLDPSNRLVTIDMGRKLAGSAPFLGRGGGSPSNTMSLGPRPTSILSGILIHPAIWPQQVWAENWGCAPLEDGGASWVPMHLTQCG